MVTANCAFSIGIKIYEVQRIRFSKSHYKNAYINSQTLYKQFNVVGYGLYFDCFCSVSFNYYFLLLNCPIKKLVHDDTRFKTVTLHLLSEV